MRLAGSQQGTSQVSSPISTTILRQQPTVLTTSASPGGAGATAATIGGKQILLQKPISLSGQNVLQLVKTSQGMAVQSLPKVNVVQKSGTTIQQQIAGGAQIVTAGGVGNQGKTALIGTNVVKLMSPAGVGGNKILMKNSNLVQVGKMGTTNAGKPAFVITNKQGQPIRSNQQFIFVTSAGAIRSVQSGSIVTSSASNFVSLVSSPQINTITSAMASGTSPVVTPTGTVKMIRGVGQQGKPITFTLPVSGLQQGNKTVSQQLISVPQKALTIGGKAVTVQLAPGNQKTVTIVSSASGGIQKTINAADLQSGGHKIVMMPSKRMVSNVITHKAIPVSAAQIDEAGGSDNNLIEGHMEVLDQLDGAFDTFDITSTDEEDGGDDELVLEGNTHQIESKKMVKRLGIAKRTGLVSRKYRQQRKQLPKNQLPKFVKMGLFGGAPPTSAEGEENTDADSSAGAKPESSGQQEDAADTSAEQLSADESADSASQNVSASNDEQQIAADDHDQQIDSSADNANVSESDAYQSGESAALKQEQDAAAAASQTNQHTGPTPSETEAANILTTIKSGDLLRNNDLKSENGNTISVSQSGGEDNVKILFSSDSSHIASSTAVKNLQKSTANIAYATSGDLDALASAALQASSGKLPSPRTRNSDFETKNSQFTFDSGADRSLVSSSTAKANANKTRLLSGGSEQSVDDVSPFHVLPQSNNQIQSPSSSYSQCKSSSDSGNKWHTVGIFKDLTQIITGYIDHDDWNSSAYTVTSENIPDLSNFKRVPLEPGTPYRFRLAALNGCGRGEFGEVSISLPPKSINPIKDISFSPPKIAVFIVQNLSARFPGCPIGNKNIKITRRCPLIMGATTIDTRRNIRIFSVFGGEIAKQQREIAAHTAGIRASLLRTK